MKKSVTSAAVAVRLLGGEKRTMSRKYFAVQALLILGVTLASGCALNLKARPILTGHPKHMYDGPKRPIEELATIQFLEEEFLMFELLRTAVTQVDGKHTRPWVGAWPNKIYVTPGKHDFRIRVWTSTFDDVLTPRYYTAEDDFSFQMKAGEVYGVHTDVEILSIVDGYIIMTATFLMTTMRDGKAETFNLSLNSVMSRN